MLGAPRPLRPDEARSLLQRVRDVATSDPNTRLLCRRLLAPLEREDRERGSNLISTLRAYYACGARVDKTADRLFLHRNSVRYRLDRLRSLLQLDIDHPEVMAALTVALACEEVSKLENADAG